jgi:hypothetical protein
MTMTLTVPEVAGEARPRPVVAAAPLLTEPHVGAARPVPDIVDVWGHDSFPASDPPANW